MIGAIVQGCSSSFKSGHYMVFSGLVVNCEIPVYTLFFASGSFYNRRKRGQWNRRSQEVSKVWCGISFEPFFLSSPAIQRSLFGSPLCLIVPGYCFEVSFQNNISISGPLFFYIKKLKWKLPLCLGSDYQAWVIFRTCQLLLSGCFCSNPFQLVQGAPARKHCPDITVYIFILAS